MKKKTMPENAAPVAGRICWLCAFLEFEPGEPGYSELTPGADMVLRCGKGYWNANDCYTQFELGRALALAERCARYKPHPSLGVTP